MTKIGFIDYFLDEWHANNYPQMIAEASGGDMTVAYAYGMIDSPRGGMTTDAWCEKMGVQKCGTIDELIEKSDVMIVLSPDNCEMHETLCQKPLSSGKRTYVDKTFAPDGVIARRIFAVAEKSGTPCYSTSALRFASEYAGIDAAKVRAVNAWGPNDFEIYAIHQLEPIMMLMKGSPRRVLATKGVKYSQLLIEFEDGRYATLSNYEEGAPFLMNVCMEGGNRVINVESDFFMGFIKEMVKFFRTGVVDVPHEETVAIMDARGAGLKALERPGEWVMVK